MIDLIGFAPPTRPGWVGLCVWITGGDPVVLEEWRLRLTAAGAVVIALAELAARCQQISPGIGLTMAARLDQSRRLAAEMADVMLVLDAPTEGDATRPFSWPSDAGMTADIAAVDADTDIVFLSQAAPTWRIADCRFAMPALSAPFLALPAGMDPADVQELFVIATEMRRRRSTADKLQESL